MLEIGEPDIARFVEKRNVLWALAGVAGIAAVTFSGWVYLYM